MKRIIALIIISSVLLSSCSVRETVTSSQLSRESTFATDTTTVMQISSSDLAEPSDSELEQTSQVMNSEIVETDAPQVVPQYYGISDPDLLQFGVDDLYSTIEGSLDENYYVLQSINSVYLSQEYIDELTANSQENVFFGYRLSELDSFFVGTRYMFVAGDTETTVREAGVSYDDTWDRIIKNVAIGTGIILVCVTVTIVSGGIASAATGLALSSTSLTEIATAAAVAGKATTVSMIFSSAATSAAEMALSFGAMGMASTAIITGFQTKDLNQTIKSALLAGSEGYKLGAIIGSISGAASGAFQAYQTKCPTWRQSELDALKLYEQENGGAIAQESFIGGEVVPLGTEGSTRPDIVIDNFNGTVKAIEVKNYDLQNNYSGLISSLKSEVADRVINLPQGSTQEILLDIRNRGYSNDFVVSIMKRIQTDLADIYADIPIRLLA